MNRFLFTLAIAFALAARLAAIESGPLTVTRVDDGDTIEARQGGLDIRIRLEFIDTPEGTDNAHGKKMPEALGARENLRRLMPVGSTIRLFSAGKTIERDAYGRTLAIIYLGPTGYRTAQEEMIRAGWTVYWRKYGDAPGAFHERFGKAQTAARAAKAGVWATNPAWMVDKSNERTASGKRK